MNIRQLKKMEPGLLEEEHSYLPILCSSQILTTLHVTELSLLCRHCQADYGPWCCFQHSPNEGQGMLQSTSASQGEFQSPKMVSRIRKNMKVSIYIPFSFLCHFPFLPHQHFLPKNIHINFFFHIKVSAIKLLWFKMSY